MEWNNFVKYSLYFVLVAGTIRVIIYFIQSFREQKKDKNVSVNDTIKPQKYYGFTKRPTVFYYIICGIYFILTVINIFLLIDEVLYTTLGFAPIIATIGAALIFVGCVLLFMRKYIGILLTTVGSLVCICFSLLSEMFHRNYYDFNIAEWSEPYFVIDEFILYLILTILPSLIILPQVMLIIRSKINKLKCYIRINVVAH